MEKTIKASPGWVDAKPGATFTAKQQSEFTLFCLISTNVQLGIT